MTKRIAAILIAVLMIVGMLPMQVFGVTERDAVSDYYSEAGYSVDTLLSLSGNELFEALSSVMSTTHTKITTYDEIRYLFVNSDADPDHAGNIRLIYSGASVNGTWDSGVTYSREHVWPVSRGTFSNSNAGADLYHIRPEDQTVNSTRGNHLMSWVDTATKQLTYNNVGIHSYINTAEDTFEPRDEVKGDVARTYFYIAARWGEDLSSPVADSTFQTLLEWNLLDPVDEIEISRNDYVQSVQGNRNAFVDYPEFGRLIYGDDVNGFDYVPVTSGDYTYCVKNGSAVILSYNGSESVVSIPSAIGGYTVSGIGCAAFANNASLTSVTIPATVVSVGTYAFYNDTALESVFVLGSAEFERRAFRDCPALQGLYFAGAAPVFHDEGADQIMISGSDEGEVPAGFKLYYVSGQSGWSGSTWSSGSCSYDAALWDGADIPAAPVAITVGTVENAEPGSSVTVPVSISGEYEAHVFNGTVSYDSSALTLDSITAGGLIPADAVFMPNGDSFGTMVPMTSITGSGVVLNLNFTVNENCTQDQPVSLTVTSFQNMPLGSTTGTDIDFTVTDGCIKLAASPTETPSGEGSYVLVTDLADITAGKYVLYGVNGSYAGAMGSTLQSGKMLAETVALNGNTVVDPEETVIWRLDEQDGYFTLYNEAAGKYCVISSDGSSGFSLADTAELGYTASAVENKQNEFFLKTTLSGCDRGISIYQNDFRAYKTSAFISLRLYKFVEGAEPQPTAEPTPTPTPEPTPTPDPVDGGFELVTDIADVTDGDYVLYGVNGSYTGAMSSTVNKGHMLASAVTLEGTTVIDPPETVVWHMEKQTDGSFMLYNEAADVYCMISTDSTGGFSTAAEATYGFTVAAAETAGSYYLTTTLEGSTRMISIYQADFRPYNLSNWHDLYLYKYVGGDDPDPTAEPTETPAPGSFTVTFVDWDGTVLSTQQVEAGGTAVAPANPVREGYTFMGWDRAFDNVTADLTVTATYSLNTYVVTFVDWDGTVLSTQTVGYGSSAEAPADPTREGYTFAGWDTPFTNVTGNLTVTATYTENQTPAGLLGDVNCDGKVDMGDISALSAYLLGKGELTAQGLANADASLNGTVDSSDLSAIFALI